MQAALEAAWLVAKAGENAMPPQPAPRPLRRLLGHARLTPAALATIRKVVDEDEAFRARVADIVTENAVGRASWLYLTRPDGWEEEVAGLAAASEAEAAAVREGREERVAARRLKGAEEALRRTEQALEQARGHAAKAADELARERQARRAAEQEAERAADELARVQAEVTVLRDRLAAVEAEAEAEAARAAGRADADAAAAAEAVVVRVVPTDAVDAAARAASAVQAAEAALAEVVAALADAGATEAGGGGRSAPDDAVGRHGTVAGAVPSGGGERRVADDDAVGSEGPVDAAVGPAGDEGRTAAARPRRAPDDRPASGAARPAGDDDRPPGARPGRSAGDEPAAGAVRPTGDDERPRAAGPRRAAADQAAAGAVRPTGDDDRPPAPRPRRAARDQPASGAVGPTGDDERPPAARPRRAAAARRRPAPLPPAVFDDTPEAADHLVRLPGAVLLVDGYNASLAYRPDLPIPELRRRLVDAVDELVARTGIDAHIVFDGAEVDRAANPMRTGGRRRSARVRFSPPDIEADDVILGMVDDAPPGRAVVVASDDRRVQDGARDRGANVISTTQLLAALRRER